MVGQRKPFLKTHLPLVYELWRKIKQNSMARKTPKQVFTEVFQDNKWRNRDSRSGPGSNLIHTEAVREALPLLIRDIKCTSLLDVPCGDYYWMKLVKLDVDYTGGDIVDEMIRINQEQFGDDRHRFISLDLLRDVLPRADLVLCRDCLVHFSYQHAFQALKNIKGSGSTYLLTTTFVAREKNEDITTGAWRPVNLQLPPFNFPPPITLIDEKCPLPRYPDKRLGLWKTADIP